MINPTFLERAKANDLIVFLCNPYIAVCKYPIAEKILVAFKRVQVGQVWQEMLPGLSGYGCDCI